MSFPWSALFYFIDIFQTSQARWLQRGLHSPYGQVMEELKLSAKERQLLEPFYTSDTYQALSIVLERWGNGIARNSAEQAMTWDQVLINRGKLQALKALHKQLKHWNDQSRKKRETK